MNRHLVREIGRQLRESGGFGLVAMLLVLVATLLAGLMLAARTWVVGTFLSTAQPATIAATLPSPAAAAALSDELCSRFPTAEAAVMGPGTVRAELVSWFPQIAGALSQLADEGFPTLLVVRVAREREADLTAWLSRQTGVGLAASSRFWREPLQHTLTGALAAGLALIITLLVGCGIVVLLTVRLMVLAHADEIEIMRLIGAREKDVRVPYLVSGALVAACGSILGAIVVVSLTRLPLASLSTVPLPLEQLVLLVVPGPVVGLAGALLGLAALPREP